MSTQHHGALVTSRSEAVELSPVALNARGHIDDRGGDELHSLLDVLMRRRKLFLAVLISFVALVAAFTIWVPKSYTTSVKLITGVNFQNPDAQRPLSDVLMSDQYGRTPETYTELLQEQPVAGKVIDDLNLDITPGDLLDHLNAKPITNTSMIELAVTWGDPVTSARVANAFASNFVTRQRELIAGQADSALTYLSKTIPDAEATMHKAEAALALFQRTHTTAYITSQTQSAFTNYAGAEQRIAQTQVDLNQAQAQLATVNSQMADTAAIESAGVNVAQNPVIANLQGQLADVEVQLNVARRQYTDQHPIVAGLLQKEAELRREIALQPTTVVAARNTMPNPTYEHLAQQANTLSAQIASDKNQLSTLGNQLGSTRKSVTALPADLARLADLQRNAKVTEGVVTALHDRYNAAVVGKAAAISDVAVTQPASPESAVRRPSLPINIILGLIVGCVLALGAVFVMEYLDRTFKNEDDVRREIGLPVLANVPRLTAGDQQALPWLQALTFESFLQIVTALRYSSVDPIRTLAVTSPQQSDGKSTLSINLGVAMAEFGPGILLVDGDLRNPALHRHLGIDNGRGFSDVLIKSASLEQLVRHTQYPGLDVLTAGIAVPNSIKLLQADSFNEFVREALARYKLVIFDTPAVLPVLDAVLISAKCDGSVMVISASKTDIRATKTALRRLYGLTPSLGAPNLIGIILNRVAPSDLDGAKYGGYYRQGIMPLPLTTNGISGDAAAPDQTPPSDQPGDRGSPTSANMFDRP